MNATSMVLFSLTFIVLFSFLLGITDFQSGVTPTSSEYTEITRTNVEYGSWGITYTETEATSTAIFTAQEIMLVLFVSATVGIVLGVAVSGVWASLPLVGGGATYAWKTALFGVVSSWAVYLGWKMVNLMPPGTPAFITTIVVVPPLGGLLWGLYSVFLRGAGGGG